MQTIDLGYRARQQFASFHRRRERWACIVAHRRAGKTVACVMDLIDAAMRSTKADPRFAYVAPYYTQAKDIAWSYVKQYGAKIPGAQTNESELRLDLPNGARVRLYGAENYDRLRGLYLDGIILDEYADMDPRVWPEVVRPALSDRGGWAVFIGTPKGRNAFWQLADQAKASPEWFAMTLKASESGLLAQGELDDARQIMTPEQYEQEYECSFEAAVIGAYYGRLMADADKDKRITGVPYDPATPVWTAWDLGIGDATSIWFAQIVGREIHVIDFYENNGVGLDHYAGVIRSKGYSYGGHLVPHDAAAKELGTGKTRLEVMESQGVRGTLVPMHSVDDGINAVRMMLPKCWFDAVKCERGVDALRLYRADYDPKGQVLRNRPVHDWTSHPADAFRYLAMGLELHGQTRNSGWGQPNTRWVA